jgi:hypothetical protein
MILITILTATPLLTSSSAVADTPSPSQEKSGPTFKAEGTINTLTGNNNTWVLGGNWNFQSVNGVADKLDIDMTMIALNGTDRHHMGLSNFTQQNATKAILENDGTLKINGTFDGYGHGKLKWTNASAEIFLDQYNVMHVYLNDNQTEDHFRNGIHGMVDSLVYGFDHKKQQQAGGHK